MSLRSGTRLGAGIALSLLVLAITAPVSSAHHGRTYWRHHDHHLRLSLNGSPGVVSVGQQITYTATITNNGPGTASNSRLPGPAPRQGHPRLGQPQPGQLQRQPDPRVQPRLARRGSHRHRHDHRHRQPARPARQPRLDLNQPTRRLARPTHRHQLRPLAEPQPRPAPERVAGRRQRRPADHLHRDDHQQRPRHSQQHRLPGPAPRQGHPRLGQPQPGQLQRQPDPRVQPRLARLGSHRHRHDHRHRQPARPARQPRLDLNQPTRRLARPTHRHQLRPLAEPQPRPAPERVAGRRQRRPADHLHRDDHQQRPRHSQQHRLPGPAPRQGHPRLGQPQPGQLQRQPDPRVQPRLARLGSHRHRHDHRHRQPARPARQPRLDLNQPTRRLARPTHRHQLRPLAEPQPRPAPERVAGRRQRRPADHLHRDDHQQRPRHSQQQRLPGPAPRQGHPRLGQPQPGQLQRQPDPQVQPRLARRGSHRHRHDHRHRQPARPARQPRLDLDQPTRRLARPTHRHQLRP